MAHLLTEAPRLLTACCAESALLPWLRRQAGRGYTLVGLEQTAESTRLQAREYLGAEKGCAFVLRELRA